MSEPQVIRQILGVAHEEDLPIIFRQCRDGQSDAVGQFPSLRLPTRRRAGEQQTRREQQG